MSHNHSLVFIHQLPPAHYLRTGLILQEIPVPLPNLNIISEFFNVELCNSFVMSRIITDRMTGAKLKGCLHRIRDLGNLQSIAIDTFLCFHQMIGAPVGAQCINLHAMVKS